MKTTFILENNETQGESNVTLSLEFQNLTSAELLNWETPSLSEGLNLLLFEYWCPFPIKLPSIDLKSSLKGCTKADWPAIELPFVNNSKTEINSFLRDFCVASKSSRAFPHYMSMTFASSETQGESVGSGKTAAKLFKAWRESPKSPWDVGCDLPRVHSSDWRWLAIGDCEWAQKLWAIRWAIGCDCDCAQSGASICRTAFVLLLYEVVANSTVHRVRFATSSFECSFRLIGRKSLRLRLCQIGGQHLYEVGANSTVHRVHEFTFDQFTVRILRLVHFLFSFIFANLLNYGISSGFVSPIFTKHSPRRNLACVAFLAWRFCREHVDPIQSYPTLVQLLPL